MGGAGTHAGEDAVKRVREQLRARGQLAHAVATRDVVRVALVVLAQELDAVHVARHARRDVVVAVEADRAVRDGLARLAVRPRDDDAVGLHDRGAE